MLFNSFDFLLFLAIVFIVFWSTQHRFKLLVLLTASYFFYLYWNPIYLILLLFSTSLDFFASLYLTSSDNKKRSKSGLILSIVLNIILLVSFKYYDFLNEVYEYLMSCLNVSVQSVKSSWLLPLGISFYTFQTISYSIDVYRKKIKPETNFGIFALFVSFFPQLIAGPIERADYLLPQLKKNTFRLNKEQIQSGIFFIIWGLFLKVVIADNISPVVDHIYATSEFQTSGGVMYGAILFTLQIYTDFSGYSLIALGAAKLFDINLSKNFRSPIFSVSITEFWKRWHISLSTWFRDYLYIPLGGNKGSVFKISMIILFTMSISGLWHGASFHHIVWGVGHGVLLILERAIGLYKTSRFYLLNHLRMMVVFIAISLLFIFFRSNDIAQSFQLFQKISEFKWSELYFWTADNRFKSYMIGLCILLIFDYLNRSDKLEIFLLRSPILRNFFLIILVLMIFLMGSNGGKQFIYFQF